MILFFKKSLTWASDSSHIKSTWGKYTADTGIGLVLVISHYTYSAITISVGKKKWYLSIFTKGKVFLQHSLFSIDIQQ